MLGRTMKIVIRSETAVAAIFIGGEVGVPQLLDAGAQRVRQRGAGLVQAHHVGQVDERRQLQPLARPP